MQAPPQVPCEAPGNTAIAVADLHKIYHSGADRIVAVQDISFTVRSGEFVAILGPSGCGKSTLLMMCAGLESISAGNIQIEGTPMRGPRASIGVMFQDSTLLPWKTVLENVLFPVRMLRRPIIDYHRRARELIRLVGLVGFEHKKPQQLSGGMRQRTAICRALVTDPDILLMDEPFSALDAMTRDDMNDLLLDLWQRYRKTGLFVTHSIREAALLADRVLVMSRRPATIIADLPMPFARPRPPDIGESAEFNAICRHLRGLIDRRSDAAA